MIRGSENVLFHIGGKSLFILGGRDIFPDMGGVGFVLPRTGRRVCPAGGQDYRIDMDGGHEDLLAAGENVPGVHKFLHNGNRFPGRHGEEAVIPGRVGYDLSAAAAFGGMDDGNIGNNGQDDDVFIPGVGIADRLEVPADLQQIGMEETEDGNEGQVMDASLESQEQGRSDRLQEL